jgi:hypothetical protein
LKYEFIVDLEAEQSTYTNAAGTWHYFYSDLLSGSVIDGGLVYGDYKGFDWYSLTTANTGQITSKLANVRINTNDELTPDWEVESWSIGQSFHSDDFAVFNGTAVYAYGDVTLTGISSIPLPATIILFASGIVGFSLARTLKRTRNTAVPLRQT